MRLSDTRAAWLLSVELAWLLTAASDVLLQRGGKARADPYADSFALSHLGFWVDNGSPYYHSNASYAASKGLGACNAALNCTLQDALLAVRDDARETTGS